VTNYYLFSRPGYIEFFSWHLLFNFVDKDERQ
jgi:hypothetical protein